MDCAACLLIIEDAVAVNHLHLYNRAGDPPELFPDTVPVPAEFIDHAALVVLIQGNGRFTLTAVAAPGTDKYIAHRVILLTILPFHEWYWLFPKMIILEACRKGIRRQLPVHSHYVSFNIPATDK